MIAGVFIVFVNRVIGLFLAGILALSPLSSSSRADDPPSAVGALLKLYQSGRLPAERQPAVVEMICNRGNEHDLRVVFDKLLSADGMSADLKLKTMAWLVDAAATRKTRPSGDVNALSTLVESKDAAIRAGAIKLASTLQLASIAPTLQKLALDAKSSPEMQRSAIAGLAALGAQSRDTLAQLAAEGATSSVRFQAVAALAGVDLPIAVKAASKALATASPADDPAPMLDALFDRKEGSSLLAAALAEHKLSVDVAKRALRYMYSVGRSDAALSDLLSKAAGIAVDVPPPTQAEVAALVKEVTEKGDPIRGEAIFRRADLSCIRCHSLQRAGGQVGPDLSAVGGSSPVDYVVNSILNPDLAVKEQYVTRLFQTADGRVLTGIVLDRDQTRVIIRDAQGKTLTIPTADIDDEVEGKSLMPQGLTKFLTRGELVDLARFISELGKPGPYGVRTAPIIQRWQVYREAPAELIAEPPHLEHVRQHLLGAPPEAWSSVYSRFQGTLPLAELRTSGEPKVVILRAELQVNEGGPVGVKISCSEPFQGWLDAEAFESRREFQLQLEPGKHQLSLRVEISSKENPELSAEFFRPAGSNAQFEVIGGN